MSKLDYCIRMQFKIAAGEFVTACMLLMMIGIVWLYMGFGGSGYVGMWLAGVPAFLAGLYLSFRVLRKIFINSVSGPASALYQSLPLSFADLVTSKIFTAGIFLLLAFLPAFLIFGNGLGSYYLSRYVIRSAMVQLLVNLGYLHSQAPLFAALTVVTVVLGCFTMAAAVQFMTAAYQSLTNRPGKLAVGIVGMILAVLGVLFLNLLPYWLLISGGIGHSGEMPHTAMMPAAGILLNVGVLLAAGKGSVRLLER